MRANGHVYDSCWEQHEVDLEEIVLAYLGYDARGAAPRRSRRGGGDVIWVAWRQQRTETLIAVVVLALLAALLVPTGLEMASRYDHDGLSACARRRRPTTAASRRSRRSPRASTRS